MTAEFGMDRDAALWRVPMAVGVAMIQALREQSTEDDGTDQFDGIEHLHETRMRQYGKARNQSDSHA